MVAGRFGTPKTRDHWQCDTYRGGLSAFPPDTDERQSPQCEGEAVLERRVLRDDVKELLGLLLRKLARPSLKLLSFQRLFAALAICRQPLIDSATVESQDFDHSFGVFSGDNTTHCPDPNLFKRFMVELSRIVCFHVYILA